MWLPILCCSIMRVAVGNAGAIPDPCHEQNHKQLHNIGSRNEQCVPKDIELNALLCDQYLQSDWYITKKAVMLNKEPKMGSCGVDTPLWLIDQFPKMSDGIMDRDVCVKTEGDACSEIITIQIKNCSSFYVYKLQKLPESLGCPAAYCFVSKDLCRTPEHLTTQSKTYPMSENDEQENTLEEDAKSPEAKYNKDVSQTEKLLIVCQAISGCVIVALVAVIIVLVCRNKRPSQVKVDKALYVIPGPAYHGQAPPRYDSLKLNAS